MRQGLTPLWSDEMVEDFFNRFIEQSGEKIMKILQRAGEVFVKNARLSGSYVDHTGNLRSSIGYIIIKDGDVLSENFQQSSRGTDKHKGLKQGRKLAKGIADMYPNGYVLIGVAGMDYAACVEAKGYDVVSSSGIKCEDDLRKASKKIFDRLYG